MCSDAFWGSTKTSAFVRSPQKKAMALMEHYFERLDLHDLDREAARSRSSTWPLQDPANLGVEGGGGEQQPQQEPGTPKREMGTPECESPIPPQQSKSEPKKMRNAWGNMSYAELITQAILSSPDKRLTLSEIYEWIVKNVPYFSDKANSPSTAGWKVSFS